MARKEQPIEAEIFSYEEYCVYELIKSKDKDITLLGPRFGEDTLFDYDLYAPDGIPSLGFNGKTAVEVKKHLSFATINEINVNFENHGAEFNILVVFFKSSVSNYPPTQDNAHGRTITYISFKELKNKLKGRSEKDKSKYYAERVKGDWKRERDELIKKAQGIIAQGNNVLFLGAGVSMSAKMPSWKDLLKGLMGEVKQLKEPTLEAFKELSSHVLEECGNSNLIMGRYLQTAISLYDDKAVFSGLIQKYLYNDNDTSSLLITLAQIIQQKKVSEVITYNFDDLLEQNLAKMNLIDGVDYTAISKDAEIKGHNTLPIYHVHGIIPQNGAVDTVVFSEEEYHKRYSTAYHWSNVEQLHALTRRHCFFVGLSMTDPNLRRLLDTAQEMNCSNGINHYAFLKRTQLDKYCVSDLNKTCKYVHVSDSLIDKKKQKEIYDLNYSVIENIFLELGVNVIWYEDHEKELPELVAKVFGMTGYKTVDSKDLLLQCEQKINIIKKIEDGIPQTNIATMSISDVVAFIRYKEENGKTYRANVEEVNEMLNELSNRIDIGNVIDSSDVEKLRKLQNRVPAFDDKLSGFGDFYQMWYETVKLFFE